jgi:hypothetical protein
MLPVLRKALPFLFAGILAAVAYDGWLFYSRWHSAREAERVRQAREADESRRTIDLLGGGQLRILHFYAIPGSIRRGERANICYGVYGAKSVRMEPPLEELHPAIEHCLQVSPSKSTAYKLVVEDGSGHTAAQSFTLEVAH